MKRGKTPYAKTPSGMFRKAIAGYTLADKCPKCDTNDWGVLVLKPRSPGMSTMTMPVGGLRCRMCGMIVKRRTG